MIFKMKKNFQMKVSHNFFHLLRYSVTRLLVYVFNLGHLQQWNFAQYHTLFCQSRFKMLPKLNKASNYCQSGENFPNLVTLTSKKHFEITCHRNLPASDGRQGRNIFAKNGVSQRTYLGPKLCSLNALFREQLLHT